MTLEILLLLITLHYIARALKQHHQIKQKNKLLSSSDKTGSSSDKTGRNSSPLPQPPAAQKHDLKKGSETVLTPRTIKKKIPKKITKTYHQQKKTQYKNPTLIQAIKNRQEQDIDTLLQNNVDINQTNHWQETALMTAARLGDNRTVRKLLAANASIDKTDSLLRNTALMWATLCNKDKTAELLLSHNARTDLFNINGHDALHFACKNNNENLIKKLLKHNRKNR